MLAAHVQRGTQAGKGDTHQTGALRGAHLVSAALVGADFVEGEDGKLGLGVHLYSLRPHREWGADVLKGIVCGNEYRPFAANVAALLCGAALRGVHDFRPRVC
jgi:hypothetical protein